MPQTDPDPGIYPMPGIVRASMEERFGDSEDTGFKIGSARRLKKPANSAHSRSGFRV